MTFVLSAISSNHNSLNRDTLADLDWIEIGITHFKRVVALADLGRYVSESGAKSMSKFYYLRITKKEVRRVMSERVFRSHAK